jgi:hypothetical protein
MTVRGVKRFALFIILPLAVALVAAVFGTSLPIVAYETTRSETFEPHNVIWQSIFGIGFYGAAWVCHLFSLEYHSAAVAWLGLLVWPLLITAIIFVVTRRVLRNSRRTRLIWGAAFLFSLCIVVGHDAENYLALHGAPVYWNYYAGFY